MVKIFYFKYLFLFLFNNITNYLIYLINIFSIKIVNKEFINKLTFLKNN